MSNLSTLKDTELFRGQTASEDTGFAIPKNFTKGEPEDGYVTFPTCWPACGCSIPDALLSIYEQHSKKWGRRYAVAVLFDRHAFMHAYQIHDEGKESTSRTPKPARRELTGTILREMTVSVGGALCVGFPSLLEGSSFTWISEHWEKATGLEFIKAVRECERIAAQGYGFIIQGSTGVGKSSALALLAEVEVFAAGYRQWECQQGEWRQTGTQRIRYITMTQLEAIIDGGRSEERTRRIDELTQVSQLYIDEFGVQTFGDRFDAQLFEILNARWMSKRPTHIASNCDIEATYAKTERGQRIWDRWQACPRFTVSGESARQPGLWKEAAV